MVFLQRATVDSKDSFVQIGMDASQDGNTVAIISSAINIVKDMTFPLVLNIYQFKSLEVQEQKTDITINTNNSQNASVAISKDGLIIVVGVPDDQNGTGAVYTYRYSKERGWVESKSSFADLDKSEYFGFHVALSADANVKEREWVESKSSFADLDKSEYFGFHVALSADGNVLAVGSPRYYHPEKRVTGIVRVYSNRDGEWAPLGIYDKVNLETKLNGILALNSNDYFGTRVALNAKGTVLLASAPSFDAKQGNYIGTVRAFCLKDNIWIPLGSPIYGNDGFSSLENAKEGSTKNQASLGSSLAMSDDGNTIILGAPSGDTLDYPGYISVWKYEKEQWRKVQDIEDKTNERGFFTAFGTSVDMSFDGQYILVGAPWGQNCQGFAKIFKLNKEKNGYEQFEDAKTVFSGNFPTSDGETVFDFFGNPSGDYLGNTVKLGYQNYVLVVNALAPNNLNALDPEAPFKTYLASFTKMTEVPCFTENATFALQDGSRKNILDLKKGDVITCENGEAYPLANIYKFPVMANRVLTTYPPNYFDVNVPDEPLTLSGAHYIKMNNVMLKSDSIDSALNTTEKVQYFYHVHIDKKGKVAFALANNILCDVWCNQHPYIHKYMQYQLFM